MLGQQLLWRVGTWPERKVACPVLMLGPEPRSPRAPQAGSGTRCVCDQRCTPPTPPKSRCAVVMYRCRFMYSMGVICLSGGRVV